MFLFAYAFHILQSLLKTKNISLYFFLAQVVLIQNAFSGSFSDSDTANWTLNCPTPTNKTSFCGPNYIIGGYLILGGAASPCNGISSFFSTSGIWSVRILLNFLKIDVWNGFNFNIQAINLTNAQTVSLYNITFNMEGSQSWCGLTTDYDAMIPIDTYFISVPGFIGFNLNLYNDPGANFWGFNNLTVIVDTCDSSCKTCGGPSQTDCYSCPDRFVISSTFSCLPCFSSCKNCNGSFYNNCIECLPGLLLANNQCLCQNTSQFPNYNGVC